MFGWIDIKMLCRFKYKERIKYEFLSFENLEYIIIIFMSEIY